MPADLPLRREGLEFWQKQLTEQQMPVLAQTARSIVKRAADDDSSAMELARLILQDASMTTRVLRMANSFYYNPGTGKITTISRAIVLLGFDAVRNICLSISLIDSFLRGPHRALVVEEMAHCFHAATQAKSLAELSRQKDPEEVFIATLLYHLGALAFWCFAGNIDDSTAERVRAALGKGSPKGLIERELLGFHLDELTASLNQHWSLSPLLGAALDPRQSPTPRTRTIGLGHDIANALAGAPGAPALEKVLAEIERTLRIPAADLRGRIKENAKAAAEAIAVLGAPEAARLIPQPEFAETADDLSPSATAATSNADANALPTPALTAEQELAQNRNLQLEILRELSALLDEPAPNVNLMLEMVLEGIYRGIGMDRAIFALLSPDRKLIRAKFALGDDREVLHTQFAFAVGDPKANPIAAILASGQSLWVGRPEGDGEIPVNAELQRLSGGAYFLMPLSVSGKPIGCLYTDRGRTARPLDAELFSQFKMFGQQARMALNFLKGG